MGIIKSILRTPRVLYEVNEVLSKRVRDVWASDKEMAAHQYAQGDVGRSTDPNDHIAVLREYGSRLAAFLRVEHDLLTRYLDYETMDDYGEAIAVALNVYADDATQPDTTTEHRIWITSPDQDVELLLNGLLHDRLRVDEDIQSIARTCCKYGTAAEEIVVHPRDGVVALNHIPTPTFRRVEGQRGLLYGYVQDFSGRLSYTMQEFENLLKARDKKDKRAFDVSGHYSQQLPPVAFEPWQIVQFRHQGKYRNSLYGHSVLEPARWHFRRLVLLEDLAVLFRAQRAAERHAFYVDVGSKPLPEARRFLNEVKQMYKKRSFMNPATGQLDMRLETLAPDEDIFIPVVDGKELTRIDTLSTPSWQHMEDIEYFQRKVFSSLQVPRAYLGHDEQTSRQTLSSEDVRFARTVLRIQQNLQMGFEKICRIHLAVLQIPLDDIEFTVKMTVPSSIYELAQNEVQTSRAQLAGMQAEMMSDRWIKRNIYHMSEDEIEQIWKEREEESLRRAKMEAAAAKAQESEMPGMTPGEAQEGVPAAVGEAPMESVQNNNINKRLLRASNITGISGKGGDRELRVLRDLAMKSTTADKRLVEIRGMLRDLMFRR